ncbi:MAG TPA: TMEM175 family protein [Thermoanaerobaculia bacterium]|nr:TMEM175 family protein [Thermoanaerobaculia bacterium]
MSLRGREISRLEGFSDAVFAFSATLLVVSLEVPATFAELLADLRGLAAFGLSFAVLVTLWTVHNAFFRRYGLTDRTTVLLNSCFLFVVLFYVYPLKFIARGVVWTLLGISEPGAADSIRGLDELGTLFVLYSVGFAAVFLFVALLYRHAWRRREALGLDAAEAHRAHFLFRHYLLFVVVGLASAGLAAGGVGLGIALPGWFYGILGPLCWANGALAERRRPRLETAASQG